MPNVIVALPNIGGALCSKFGWRSLLDCRAVTLPRRETRWNLQGCPKLVNRSQPLVGQSTPLLWGHLEDILLLNRFFSDCWYVAQLRKYSPTKLCDGAQMAIFGDFFASCVFSEPRVEDFRPASEIRTKTTPCVEVWQTSNLRRLRLGEEKKRRKKERTNHSMKIYMVSLFHRATIKN